MAVPDLTLICPQCKHEILLRSTNTVLMWVKQHEYMSHIQVTCPLPQCSHYWLTFLNADDPASTHRLVKLIREARWRVRIINPTPQHVINQYKLVADVEMLQPMELSTRQEAQIKALAWELEGVVTVQDILDVDIENRLPKEWI